MPHFQIKDSTNGETNVLSSKEATYLSSSTVNFCPQLIDLGRVDLLGYIASFDFLFWTSALITESGYGASFARLGTCFGERDT